MSYRNYPYSSAAQLKAAGLVASSEAGSLIVDVGSGYVEGVLIVDVTAIEIASNDEAYTIVLQGSPDADFGTAANIVELMAIHMGAKETKLTDCDRDDAIVRLDKPCNNTHGDTNFRYLRLYTVVAGTIATGINYEAHFARVAA